jgi:hypothetical protein
MPLLRPSDGVLSCQFSTASILTSGSFGWRVCVCFDRTRRNASVSERIVFRKLFAARQYENEKQRMPTLLPRMDSMKRLMTLQGPALRMEKRRSSGLMLSSNGFEYNSDLDVQVQKPVALEPPKLLPSKLIAVSEDEEDEGKNSVRPAYKPNHAIGSSKVQPLPAPTIGGSDDGVSPYGDESALSHKGGLSRIPNAWDPGDQESREVVG